MSSSIGEMLKSVDSMSFVCSVDPDMSCYSTRYESVKEVIGSESHEIGVSSVYVDPAYSPTVSRSKKWEFFCGKQSDRDPMTYQTSFW